MDPPHLVPRLHDDVGPPSQVAVGGASVFENDALVRVQRHVVDRRLADERRARGLVVLIGERHTNDVRAKVREDARAERARPTGDIQDAQTIEHQVRLNASTGGQRPVRARTSAHDDVFIAALPFAI